jgi:hypothetical protein
MRSLALLMALAAVTAVAGCGGSGSDDSTSTGGLTVLHTPTATTASGPPRGPLVRICDRALAAELGAPLREQGFRGQLNRRPQPSGAGQQSACDLGDLELSMDAARDAVQRYQNRIVETAQFSESIPSHVPQTVKGVGDPDLAGAGANWIAFLHQLLSARGKRVLIVTVNGAGLSDTERLDAAKAVSLAVWDRLGS